MAPVIPAISKAFAGVPNVEALVPVAIAIPALVLALTSPLAGWAADKFGRRNVLVIALAAYSVCGTAPLWLETLGQIIASRALLGLCEAVIMTSSTALICDYFDGKAREKWLAQQSAIASLSAIVFALTGGALGESGWRVPFAAYGLGVLLIAPILLFITEPERAISNRASAARINWGLYGWICLLAMLSSLLFYVVPIQIGFLLETQGVTSPNQVGLATAAGNLAVFIGAILFRRVSHLPATRLSAVGFAIMGVGLAIIARVPVFAATVAGSVVHGFGWGIVLPTVLTWAMAQLHFDLRGRGTGIFMGAVFVGQFLSPLLVLAAKHFAGDLSGAILIFGGLGALTALATALVRSDPR